MVSYRSHPALAPPIGQARPAVAPSPGVAGSFLAGVVGSTTLATIYEALRTYYGRYNVLEFGAVGDGVTDDTAAIQAAIDAGAGQAGSVVLFPPQPFLITATLIVPSFVMLLGIGVPFRASELDQEFGDPDPGGGSTIVIGGDKDFTMVENSDATNGNVSVAVIGLRFDQTGASGDVDIIRLSKSWRSRIMDNYFKGASTTHRRGVQMAAHSERSWIMHNVFEGCGLYLNEVNAQWVVDNEIGAATYGIEYLGSTVSQTGYGSHIHANHIYNSSENQIHLDKVNGATITENHMEDGDKHGIALRTGCKNNRITHNVVKKNSKSAAGIYSGIDLNSEDASSPTEYNDISDNAVYDDFGVPTQGYGVRLRSLTGSQTNNNTITNNTLYGNTVAQLEEAAGLTNFIDTQVGWGSGSATWNPASVNNGAQTTTTVTVSGAKLGDLVDVSFSLDLQAMQLTGHVSAANTVTVVLRNGTGGAIDLGSGTLKAQIRRG